MDSTTARMALQSYDLPDASQIHFIGQSQNTTFRVETPSGEKFLLRLHAGIGASDAAPDIWQQPGVIGSELDWLQELARGSALIVPQPVATRAGDLVSSLIVSGHAAPVQVSVLRWVEGDHLEAALTSEQARKVGVLMAQMHERARSWVSPPAFTRPSYDAAFLNSNLPALRALRDQSLISSAHYEIIEAVAAKIAQLHLELARTRSSWGLIHADLQDANYLWHQGEVRPIDFGRCGFGFYLYDLALSLGYVEDPMHADFLAGYESVAALPPGYERIVEAFFVSSTIENFAFLSANPQEHQGLAQAVPQVVRTHFEPYLQEKPFLFGA